MTEYHPGFADAFDNELEFVRARWSKKAEARGWTEDEAKIDKHGIRGVAFSGGGIRSASFCMGVIQALHLKGVFDRLHYMSSVSGGGYAASSLTWFMTQGFGTTENDFPFWGGVPAAVRNASDGNLRTKKRTGPLDGRVVLDYIRQRTSYLNPGAGFTVVSALAIVLRSVLTSLFGFILILALIFTAATTLGLLNLPLADNTDSLPKPLQFLASLDWLALTGLGLLFLLGLSVILYSLASGLPGTEKSAYHGRRFYQKWAGTALGIGLALLVTSLIATAVRWLNGEGYSLEEISTLAGGSTAIGTAGGFIVKSLRSAAPTILTKLMIMLLPPLFLLLLVAGLSFLGAAVGAYAADYPWGVWILLGVTLIYCLVTNINLTGLHRFYRDRLMETFMPDPADIPEDLQAAKTDANEKNLADVCGPEHEGPYHLINANVVLLGSKRARQRSRMGDSFLLSPLYCGSEATGYVSTRDWLPGTARLALGRRVGAMKLATAMAISGAALNPRAGGDGQGPTKGGAISALLNLLNLRLGYWVPSPKKARADFRLSYASPPNFIIPGLVQGLVGSWHNEAAHWIELSDGGHFENTGVYELVRRGARTIIFADGSTDPDISLSSLANVLEKIYIDFGVQVAFDPKADFIRMLKGTAKGNVLADRLQLSEAGYAVATLKYPDGPPGILFYVKSTLIPELPASLYSYKAGNPLFPAESLADQFFSEQQFEAYRALGFLITEELMKKVDGEASWAGALGLVQPPPAAAQPPPAAGPPTSQPPV